MLLVGERTANTQANLLLKENEPQKTLDFHLKSKNVHEELHSHGKKVN